MVKFLLTIAADLKNLTNLQPTKGCDNPDFTYLFKLKCSTCEEVTAKEVCLSLNEQVEVSKKIIAHLTKKCKFCDIKGTIRMIDGQGYPLPQKYGKKKKRAPLMLFDCNGYEPLHFVFGRGWRAESLEGIVYEDIDLSSGQFSLNDGTCVMRITNLKSEFVMV